MPHAHDHHGHGHHDHARPPPSRARQLRPRLRDRRRAQRGVRAGRVRVRPPHPLARARLRRRPQPERRARALARLGRQRARAARPDAASHLRHAPLLHPRGDRPTPASCSSPSARSSSRRSDRLLPSRAGRERHRVDRGGHRDRHQPGTALGFMRGRRHDLNIRGACLHMLGDAGASAGVVVPACSSAPPGALARSGRVPPARGARSSGARGGSRRIRSTSRSTPCRRASTRSRSTRRSGSWMASWRCTTSTSGG